MLAPFYGFRGLWDDALPLFSNTGPHYDVRESQNALKIEVEVPRYKQDELHVTTDVERGLITVTGTKQSKSQDQQREGENFEHLLVATEPLSGFKRTFRVAPTAYDISGMRTVLDRGVLCMVIPKAKIPSRSASQQQQLQLQSGQQQQQSLILFGDREGAEKTTPQQLNAIRNDRNIMSIKKKESAEALTYEVFLSNNVDRDHIELELNGRMLEVRVRYVLRTAHTEDSVMYANSFMLPQGTKREDIHTDFEPGKLTITLTRQAPNTPKAINVRQGQAPQQQGDDSAPS